MSRYVTTNIELLKALQKMNSRQRVQFLQHADNSLITAICECALNVLKGNVELTKVQKSYLSRMKKFIRLLAKKTVSLKKKRKHLVQKGGSILIPLLVNAAISALISQLSH